MNFVIIQSGTCLAFFECPIGSVLENIFYHISTSRESDCGAFENWNSWVNFVIFVEKMGRMGYYGMGLSKRINFCRKNVCPVTSPVEVVSFFPLLFLIWLLLLYSFFLFFFLHSLLLIFLLFFFF